METASPGQIALALLPEIVLSVWAMVVLLVDVLEKGDRGGPSKPAIGGLAAAGVVLAGGANAWLASADSLAVTSIAVDGFRIFSNTILLVAALLFFLVSGRYLDEENLRLGELHVLVLFATVGMMVFAGARDLMLMFIGLEVLSVPVYVLTGVNRRDARSAEGALKYFLLGAFSSAFFLLGVAQIWGATGTTNLGGIANVVGIDGLGASPLLVTGMVMLAVGFGFKVAAVPFHMWTPDAYEGAPAPVTAFMATAVKAAAFAAFLRVFLTAFQGLYETWDIIAIALGTITMVAANLIALVEGNVKRMLAYSSIAHAGYLLVALAAASLVGAASFLFYAVVYTLMTIGAFAIVTAVAGPRESRLGLDAYSGLGWRHPVVASAMTIFLLSLAGFPLTGGFIAKVFILRAAVERGLLLLAIVLVIASLVSYWYYLRVAWFMWFRSPGPETQAGPLTLSRSMTFALAVTGAAVIILGVFPGPLLDIAERSAASLLQFRAPPGGVGAVP
ncbi:MAG: NADH-quinone oxidoreductase subunit N [Gemmatimonadetes bacterium]|nr:NADH-quinone oxidoreductase subunit N [Gemmatimonadota bacterium]